jgi:hypothetical protein
VNAKQNQSRTFRDDPGVAEVRRWRAKLLKQGGGTLKGVVALLRERQDSLEAAGKIIVRKHPDDRAGKRKKKRAA